MNFKNRIALVGMMGCGKSTVGKRIAQVLGMEYVDLDSEFERVNGKIEDYFKRYGEENFRSQETKILEDVSKKEGIVISTGGGIVENRKNLEILKSMKTFYLKVDPEILWKRVSQSDRPLVKEGKEGFLKRFERRKAIYENFEIIDANYHDVEEIMAKIVAKLVGFEKIDEFDLYQHVEIFHGKKLDGVDLSIVSKNFKNIWDFDGIEFDDGEGAKDLQHVQRIWNLFHSKELNRNSKVRIAGGGTLTDMAGFACITYMRGMNFELIPTTFLGMVDASVGGKFAINFNGVKNLIGSFGKPDVLIDPIYALSLEYERFMEGIVESAKIGIVYDKVLFEYMEEKVEKIKLKNLRVIDEIIRRSVMDKLEITFKDPQDKELRHILNFGHTVGHGIESASNNAISHGRAVALGMIIESKLFSPAFNQRIRNFLDALDLKIEEVPNWKSWIKSDKKRENDFLIIPVLEEIGRSRLEKIWIKDLSDL
ncbi:shikimate kinase [Athalassotoga saccharophila]|uniref:shikimate kinase n=1 Tax=Athalassotoga saccharophila TaxID=1441386 RepID=UPI00137B822C|nr:shikimate kinase [Athalassotoga saccharophila]BBJ28076.1 3-dehydroquinate synthase [Athalassotoga saccharophila]